MIRILVIEDEPLVREAFVTILRRENYYVIDAEDGAAGVQLALEQQPDLIVCDVNMPEMDGFQVLSTLRQNAATRLTPFIFLTAISDRPFLRHAMELGADDYVTKPVTAPELLAAVKARVDKLAIMQQTADDELKIAQKQLAQMVAHELRTPLVSVVMVQELMARQIGQLSREELQELLTILGSGSRRLNHLVEQMVLMTQLETRNLSEASIASVGMTCPLWEVFIAAESMARKFAYRRREGKLRIVNQHPDVQLLCSKKALSHALGEIIANALDFSPEDQEVLITQTMDGGCISIVVTDLGVGIPPHQINQAMRYFQQIDRERQEQQGMGMGLPLAARIIELHGGSVRVNSRQGDGTSVEISLPVAVESLEALYEGRDARSILI